MQRWKFAGSEWTLECLINIHIQFARWIYMWHTMRSATVFDVAHIRFIHRSFELDYEIFEYKLDICPVELFLCSANWYTNNYSDKVRWWPFAQLQMSIAFAPRCELFCSFIIRISEIHAIPYSFLDRKTFVWKGTCRMSMPGCTGGRLNFCRICGMR